MDTIYIIILTILVLFVCIFIYLLCSSEVKYQTTLKRNCLMAKIVSKYTYKHIDRYKIDLFWWKDKPVEKISINSFDGLKLQGYFLKANTNNFAVVVHGYGAKAMEMQQYVKLFYEKNYNILTFDNRGHGNSQGKTITMGYYDYKDVQTWIDFLIKKYPQCKIVVFGLSMGGATVCMYSGTKKPQNVKAIISDCAYSSAYDVFNNIANKSIILSIIPTMKAYNIYLKYRIGFKLTDVEPKEMVKKCDVPILFIHGDKDMFVPFYMRDVLYNNTSSKFRHKLTINKAGHALSLPLANEKYKNTVYNFLNEYLEKN